MKEDKDNKKNKRWLKPKQRVPAHFDELNAAFPTENVSKTLTPNLRALRMAMTASDLLLSMGVSANSVVSRALDITEAYCDQPVTVTISYNLLTISQVRGISDEPLTLIRPIPMRDINNMTVQAVQQLIYEIRKGQHTLDEAEAKLDNILNKPKAYPSWIPPLANAAIAPTVVLMFTTNWRVVLVTAILAILVDRLLVGLARQAMAPFFRQVIASFFVTMSAAVIAWLARDHHIQFFEGMNPTTIVVGGIFLLISGLAFVGSVQDALEEYYLTATARLMRVVMLTAGIVVGILIGLYTANKLGIDIAVSPDPLALAPLHFQVIGGALAAAAYALATHTRLRAVIWTALLAGGALSIMYASRHLDISVIPASGVAAGCVALVAALFSRLWRAPASGVIACGILPLVPGLALYTSLMQLISYPPGDELFFRGVGTFTTGLATALSIATGASFGYMLGRPLHRHLTYKRNLTPFAEYVRQQLHVDSKTARLVRLTKRIQPKDSK